jgi:DHA1 family inner membrane transport protein
MGTAEFISIGLLPSIAADFHVSVSKAGLVVASYATGLAIGTPIVTILIAKFNKKYIIISTLTLFCILNAMSAFSPSFNTLIMVRAVLGVTHGVFFAIGSTVATSLVEKH